MSARSVIASAAERAVAKFLTAAATRPSGLTLEGDAGIGKSTLWLTGIEQAATRGFRVLGARPVAAESVMSYGSLADLFADVDSSTWANLPPVQRLALDRVLLRADTAGETTDQRVVGAACLAAIERLADDGPLLLAIDDLQWLDQSSARAVAFAARRLSGPVGILATVRTTPADGRSTSWLQLPRPDAIRRITLPPMSLGGLQAMIVERLGHSLPRPTMIRIHELSAGNPFYALELARTVGTQTNGIHMALPGTLSELVLARIDGLDDAVQRVLLAAAALVAPTVELIALATNSDVSGVVGSLEDAERKGIVGIEGQRVRFTHPLLAQGVYANAGPSRRRAMHRRLADIVEHPELHARHLALAATSGDVHTVQALDAAAELARARGAPAAAAELVELALRLGGDTPERHIRAASYHSDAGDTGRARAILERTVDTLAPGSRRAEALRVLAWVRFYDDSFPEAANLLERALDEVEDDLALRAQLLVTWSFVLLNCGRLADAMRSVEDGVIHAERLGQPQLLSQALSFRVVLGALRGDGVDVTLLRRALELEDPAAHVPITVRASVQRAVLSSWTGELESAHHAMLAIRRRCIENGEEGELVFVALYSVLLEIWRAEFAEATTVAEDAMERALQLGGDLPVAMALTMRVGLGVYAGRAEQARHDAAAALAASQRCGATLLVLWLLAFMGFLEVSRGDYEAALAVLEPLVSVLNSAPDATEIFVAPFLPDAAEAMIQLGRFEEAESLIEVVERNGRRTGRAWMLAVGARCRAMLLAARGEVDDACVAAKQAMVAHERLPMPFERARTQLLLGQLQRRRRRKGDASVTLGEALRTFERLDVPLWADRARAELDRANVGPRRAGELTPSEQRVAELAASGMTNRDVAAALFLSPKTVEANLSRIYQKLGIRSRAELGRHFSA